METPERIETQIRRPEFCCADCRETLPLLDVTAYVHNNRMLCKSCFELYPRTISLSNRERSLVVALCEFFKRDCIRQLNEQTGDRNEVLRDLLDASCIQDKLRGDV